MTAVETSDKVTPSSTKDNAQSLFSPHSYDSPATTAAETLLSTSNSSQSSSKQNKVSQTSASSAFGLAALSGTGRGLVSGLTSLKNSIMIPALSSTPSSATPTGSGNNRGDRTPGSLTGSQSSLLEFLEDSSQPSFMQHQEHHHHQHTTHRHKQQQTSSRSSSTASSVAGSPSLFRSMFLRSGNDTEYFSGRDTDGSSSMFLERRRPSTAATHHDRSRKEGHYHHHHTSRHSTSGPSSDIRNTSLHQQEPLFQKQSRRKRVASQNTSAVTQSLSTHEWSFNSRCSARVNFRCARLSSARSCCRSTVGGIAVGNVRRRR